MAVECEVDLNRRQIWWTMFLNTTNEKDKKD